MAMPENPPMAVPPGVKNSATPAEKHTAPDNSPHQFIIIFKNARLLVSRFIFNSCLPVFILNC
jgi:hypothetical protein